MRLNNIKIRKRLILAFGAVVVIMTMMAIDAISEMGRISGLITKIHEHPLLVSNDIRDIKYNILMYSALVNQAENEIDPATKKHIIDEMKIIEAKTHQLFDEVLKHYLGNPEKIKNFHNLFSKAIKEHANELNGANKEKKDTKHQHVHLDKLNEQANSVIEFADNMTKEFRDYSQAEYEEAVLHKILYLIASFIVCVFSSVYVTRSITDPLNNIRLRLSEMADGDFSENVDIQGKDEITDVAYSLEKMQGNLKHKSDVANEIARGNLDKHVVVKSKNDSLAQSINNMITVLKNNRDEVELKSWIKTGQNLLNERMRGEHTLSDLCLKIINFLAKYLNAKIGAVYVKDDENTLTFQGGYAYDIKENVHQKIKYGESLIGQAAAGKEIVLLTDIPDDYVKVNSASGEALPKHIIIIPLVFDGSVKGVIELGSLTIFSEKTKEFLQLVSGQIAVALNTARARTKMEKLLEKTQIQASELQSQQEELRVTNEELSEQTHKLQRSEERLKEGQEELQATNEELEEKTQYLEEQRTEIMEKNKKLETAQNELEKRAQELFLSSKYKSEFLANMSHELRTPLNSLLILSRELMENKEENLQKHQVESSEIIHKGGTELLNLINEILDLSKIESGKMSIHQERVKLYDVAENMGKMFKPLIEEKELYLNFTIEDDVPREIHTDPQRLEQILRNLLSNAVKFTHEGGITLKFSKPQKNISFRNKSLLRDETLAISVIDTGVGIPETQQRRIFEAFQQLDGSISRKYGGTGLGLSISRELARLLNGEIQLISEDGEGSTFTLYIPFHVHENIAINEKQKFSQTDMPPPFFKTIEKKSQAPSIPDDRENIEKGDRVILIIEDDVNFAKVLSRYCKEKEFKFLHAGDGERGLDLARDYLPGAIILDINLPGMKGWAVLESIKDDSKLRHIPVHMMSVDSKTLEAFKKGAIGFLTKPVEKEQLDEAFLKIHKLIEREIKELLLVEDDVVLQKSIKKLIGNGDVKIKVVSKGSDALRELKKTTYDCMILDLALPDMTGFQVLEKIDKTLNINKPPVVVYTGREITHEEEYELQKYASSIIIKGVKSEERLLDETAMFLHRIVDNLPPKKRKMILKLHDKDYLFENKKILIVDDDMRNVFALSRIIEGKGAKVLKASNGKKALDVLKKNEDINIVLMDIMMPVMDGFEAIEKIREQKKFIKLPILAVTAKAMKEDRNKCIEVGANDYLPKPIDIDRLLSMMRIWLYN